MRFLRPLFLPVSSGVRHPEPKHFHFQLLSVFLEKSADDEQFLKR